MFPDIRDEDNLIVRPLRTLRPRRGEIISYVPGAKSLIAHRVVGFQSRDGNPYVLARADKTDTHQVEQALMEQIVGIVVGLERHGRIIYMDTCYQRIRGLVKVGVWLFGRLLSRSARSHY